jgi:hypothetical protein
MSIEVIEKPGHKVKKTGEEIKASGVVSASEASVPNKQQLMRYMPTPLCSESISVQSHREANSRLMEDASRRP